MTRNLQVNTSQFVVRVGITTVFEMCSISIVQVLLTFNTGLYESIGSHSISTGHITPEVIPSRVERRTEIIKQLKRLKSHVICLQEAWFGEDVGAIVNGLRQTFPYSFSSIHDSEGNLPLDGLNTSPPCDPIALGTFLNCLTTHCPDATTIGMIADCLVNCLAEFAALDQECWACVISAGPVLGIVAASCTSTSSLGLYQKMNPTGLLLLSSTEMSNLTHIDYHQDTRELTERGYLKAEVSQIGEVVCTHTTAYFVSSNYLEYELQATGVTSYEEQGQIEINRLVADFSTRDQVLILGDFNVGPAISPNVEAQMAGIYDILTTAFDHHVLPQCSFCNASQNSYNGVQPPVSIDHVFYKGYKFQSVIRVLDSNYVSGLPLSDHYGVVQRLTRQ